VGGLPVGAPAGGARVSKTRHIVTQPHHLAARFFGSLSSRPPEPSEEAWAASQLLPGELELWQRMSNQDRRHSAIVARRFAAARPQATRAEVAGRRGRRFTLYHDHEQIGAGLARTAGSEPETVDLIAERGPAFATLHECDRA
jgi:hypothetical protein